MTEKPGKGMHHLLDPASGPKLTAAEIERIKRNAHYSHPTPGKLRALCDMASASLASAGDGEVEGLIERLNNDILYLETRFEHQSYLRDVRDTIARQQAEIASLRDSYDLAINAAKVAAAERDAARERVEKAEGELEVEQETSKAAHEDSVAEILRANAAVHRATELQDELDQANATVARLRERLEKAERAETKRGVEVFKWRNAYNGARTRAEARVAELTRVVGPWKRIIDHLSTLKWMTDKVELYVTVGSNSDPTKFTGAEVRASYQALTAAQGEREEAILASYRRGRDEAEIARLETESCSDSSLAGCELGALDDDHAAAQGEEPAAIEPAKWKKKDIHTLLAEFDAADNAHILPEIRHAQNQLIAWIRRHVAASDHTAAIREAIKALESINKFASPNPQRTFDVAIHNLECITDRARAAHAKLTEIIEGGKDA